MRKHPIKIEDMKVLARVDNWSLRGIREPIEIVKNPNFLNRDNGLTITRSWIPNLTKLNQPINTELVNKYLESNS